MAKLKGMTNEELAKVIEESGFLAKGRFEDQKEAVKEEGVIGIAETAKGNFMVYCVGEGSKLFNTSVHPTKELANGKAAQRILAMAAEDVAEDEAEDTAEGVTEDKAMDTAEDKAENATEDVTGGTAEDKAEDKTEDTAEDVAEDEAGDTAEDVPIDEELAGIA